MELPPLSRFPLPLRVSRLSPPLLWWSRWLETMGGGGSLYIVVVDRLGLGLPLLFGLCPRLPVRRYAGGALAGDGIRLASGARRLLLVVALLAVLPRAKRYANRAGAFLSISNKLKGLEI
jgi:hypothetical protein